LQDAPQDAIRLDGDAEMAPVNGAAPRIIRNGDDTARGKRGGSIWKVLITSVRSTTSELLFSLMLRRHPHRLSGVTMILSALCNGPPRFSKTQRSTPTTTYVS